LARKKDKKKRREERKGEKAENMKEKRSAKSKSERKNMQITKKKITTTKSVFCFLCLPHFCVLNKAPELKTQKSTLKKNKQGGGR
jgi:hypothetical protein